MERAGNEIKGVALDFTQEIHAQHVYRVLLYSLFALAFCPFVFCLHVFFSSLLSLLSIVCMEYLFSLRRLYFVSRTKINEH